MNTINWIEVLKWVGIVTLVLCIVAVFVYFTAISIIIFIISGGLFGGLFFFDENKK